MTGIARSYPCFKGFSPAWVWSFAQTIGPGEQIQLPAVNQTAGGGGMGGGFGPMPAPAGDPAPSNAVFEPGRWMITGIIRTVVGTCYVYVYWMQTGSSRRLWKLYVNNWTAITELGVSPVLRLAQVDYWWIVILNRSAVNPASVEGAVSIYARGNL